MSTDDTAANRLNSPEVPPGQSESIGVNPIMSGHPTIASAGDGPTLPYGERATGYPALSNTLELLLDVRINVSVEVGRVQMPVRQVMELGPGAVIELERSASEPVEIHANGRCIGRGEIVVVGEQFGVRVTELGPSQT